jgi:uncharacterized membrane protein
LLGRLGSVAGHLLEMPGWRNLQNSHPLVVHFPIALLVTAALVYWLGWLARRETWAWTGLWMLVLGALGAVVAVWTGLGAGESVMIAPRVRDNILIYHKYCMLTAAALSVLLSLWAGLVRPMPYRGRIAFLLLMAVMAGILAKGADYGGWMVFGYNAGGSLPQPIEFQNEPTDAGRG